MVAGATQIDPWDVRPSTGRITAISLPLAKRSMAMRYMVLTCVSLFALMSATYVEKAPVSLGLLTCTLVKPGQDTAHKMSCGFKPVGSGAEETYSGMIRESSEDLPHGKIVLIWTVLGPAEGKMRAGLLAQPYMKAASAPGQTSVLVGEANSAIALQYESNNGAAAYEAITRMELQLTGTPA